MYIAAVRPSCFLLAIAVLTPSLHAADEHSITVKTSSIENRAVRVIADFQGKGTELDCILGTSTCSQPQPGEYNMRPATADEGIYNDCTNVVLLKSSGAEKEKIGVYCWLNDDDCYIVSCQRHEVATATSDVPSVLASPEISSLPLGGGPMPLIVSAPSPGSPHSVATKRRSLRCLYLWKCSPHNR